MYDLLGTPITVGATVMFPGGNARFGGLNLQVGIVTKLTDKRATILATNLADPRTLQQISKSGPKLLVIADTTIMASPAVQKILESTKEQQ